MSLIQRISQRTSLIALAALPALLLTAPCRAAKPTLFELYNRDVAASWRIDTAVQPVVFASRSSGRKLTLPPELFEIALSDGSRISASKMRIVGKPTYTALRADSHAARFAERQSGRELTVTLEEAPHGIRAVWQAVLRTGSRYLRQSVTITAGHGPLPIQAIWLIDDDLPGAHVVGTVNGSPIVAGDLFLGVEHPLARNTVEQGHVRCLLPQALPLLPGQSLTCSSVLGFTAPGQLRRDFLAYVERERAHPYRTFLHYNSWYDLGEGQKYTAASAVAVINAFGDQLHKRRGTALSSFLFDDGWDDPKTLWGFASGFPQGFSPVKAAAEAAGGEVGVWMSPWGGYGEAQSDRLKFGRANGFETNQGGFALSGPIYYKRFRDVCVSMMRKYGVNQFKFDGTGNVNTVIPGSAFGSDFEAMIHLVTELRQVKPDLFVNLTTGTWPSPFWLRYVDSIWRGRADHSFAGVGTNRQRWITYRDSATYADIVTRGPLYPINSLMLHGLIYARYADRLGTDPGGDFPDEVRSYFGSGTQLQEMYITPSLLSKDDWDVLAESANWSHSNASTLLDTHWIGGDPGKLEPYGWAAWSAAKGIVTLRNPSDKPAAYDLDIDTAFELPGGAPHQYTAHSPWRADSAAKPIELIAGTPVHIPLQPFEVLTLEAVPASRGAGASSVVGAHTPNGSLAGAKER